MDDGYPYDDNSSENEDDDQNNPDIAALEQPPPAIRPWGDISFDLLMQYEFKAFECPELLKLSPEIMKFHNPKRCPYVHKGQTFRRSLCEFYYKPQICPSIPHCKDKNKCQLAHNIYEYCLHPDIFGNTICKDGIFCTTYPCLFAHSSGTKHERPPLLILPPRPPPTPRRAIVSQPPLLCRQTLQPLVAVGELRRPPGAPPAANFWNQLPLVRLGLTGNLPFTPSPSSSPARPPGDDEASTSGTK